MGNWVLACTPVRVGPQGGLAQQAACSEESGEGNNSALLLNEAIPMSGAQAIDHLQDLRH